MAVERGAHVIRTHDVAETCDAALIGNAFARDRTVSDDGVRLEELDVQSVGEAERHADRIGADPDAVAGASLHVFELAGLSSDERDAVAAAASEAGATVVPGTEGSNPVGERALLFGTVPALTAVADTATGVSRALDGALDALADTFS
jgi:dihydropteroate synthase